MSGNLIHISRLSKLRLSVLISAYQFQLRFLLYLVSTHCLFKQSLPFQSNSIRGLSLCIIGYACFNIGSVLPSAPIRSTEFNPPPLNLRRFASASTLPLGLLRIHRIREVLHNGFPRGHRLLPDWVVYLIYHASQRPVVCTLIS